MKPSSLLCLVSLTLLACYEAPGRGELENGPAVGPKKPPGLSIALTPEDLRSGQKRIRFGVAPFLGTAQARTAFQPLVKHLSVVLTVPVDLVVGTSYQGVIDDVVANEVDIAILPPASYVLAKRRAPKIQLLASEIAYGATSYSSIPPFIA